MVTVNVITKGLQTITVAEQGLPEMEIEKAVVRTALNQISGCTLAIPSSNKAARILTSGIDNIVEVLNDNKRVFYGSVSSVKESLFGGFEIVCDGALSWLANVVKQPFYVNNKTHADYIETILSQHRTAMSEAGMANKTLSFGGVVGFSGMVDIHHSDEYVTTLDLLREAVEMYGGYFFETFGGTAGSPSVGWIREPIVSSGQVLEFGVNIASLETMLDFSEYASRVYAINGDGLKVTGGYVVDSNVENTFGRKDYSYKSQAETQAELDAEAAAILAVKKVPIRSIEATAAMLERAGCNINAMKLGSTVEAIDRKLGENITLMVNSVERDYINTLDGNVVLGRAQNTLTSSIGNGGSSSSASSGGGGGGYVPIADAVLFTPQNLTSNQQAVARNNIGAFDGSGVPTRTSQLTNDSGFVTQAGAASAAPVQSVNGKTGAVVLKTSDLQNDSGYITSVPVASVNGKTGAVVLDAEDVGALPDDTFIPSKTSELVNDAHFVTEAEAGVSSVNGQTGVVLLTTSDIANTSGYITANDIPQEVPTADASANGMVLGVDNGRYTFVRMTGGISDVYMGGASIIQQGTTIAVIPYATTSSQGVVQLYDGTDSTSKGLVPTADALRGVAQRVGNLETRSANWLTETQIKELIDSMVQEQIAMYQRRVFALEDNKEDIDITSLSDLTSHDILYGEHWKQIGTSNNYGAVLYNPESKTIGGSSSDLIYLKRGYIIGVSKNSWFVTSDQSWYCSHVFLSYPKMQAVYAYDEENNIRYIAADIPAEIVEQAKVLAEDFLSQIESLETEI